MGSRPFSGGARELKYFLYPVITERASEHVCISKRSQDVMVSIVVCVCAQIFDHLQHSSGRPQQPAEYLRVGCQDWPKKENVSQRCW